MNQDEIKQLLRNAKEAGELDELLRDINAEDALDGLLHEVKKQGVVIGLESLIEEVKEKLTKLRDKENIELYDEDGNQIRSIRQFAEYMGNKSAHSNLSHFVTGKTTPCFGTIRQAAKAFGITYVISNKDKEMINYEIE